MAVNLYYTTGFMGHIRTVNHTVHEQSKASMVQVWCCIYSAHIHHMYGDGGHP